MIEINWSLMYFKKLICNNCINYYNLLLFITIVPVLMFYRVDILMSPSVSQCIVNQGTILASAWNFVNHLQQWFTTLVADWDAPQISLVLLIFILYGWCFSNSFEASSHSNTVPTYTDSTWFQMCHCRDVLIIVRGVPLDKAYWQIGSWVPFVTITFQPWRPMTLGCMTARQNVF